MKLALDADGILLLVTVCTQRSAVVHGIGKDNRVVTSTEPDATKVEFSL